MSPRPNTTTPATPDLTAMSPVEIKAHFKKLQDEALAAIQEGRKEKIKAKRQEVLDYLEGSGITLQEVFTYSDGPKVQKDKPKPGWYYDNGEWKYYGKRLPQWAKGKELSSMSFKEGNADHKPTATPTN